MAKIMLVEDDPMIAEIFVKKFQDAGFEVVNATNGKEVLRLAIEDKFDLILLDLVLPDMNGLEVLKELRQSDSYDKDLKIIILSNLNKEENEKTAIENGANDFISKTQFGPSDLVHEVKRLLDLYEEQKKNKDRLESEEHKDKRKRILFIEDEEIFLEMFGKKLEDEGYAVEYAKNGVWGSKLAAEKHYDLIVTDIVMPAMPGDEIIRRLKLDDKTKDIPIIVLSASIEDEAIDVVKGMGVSEFFEKTRVVPSDLARRVAEIIN